MPNKEYLQSSISLTQLVEFKLRNSFSVRCPLTVTPHPPLWRISVVPGWTGESQTVPEHCRCQPWLCPRGKNMMGQNMAAWNIIWRSPRKTILIEYSVTVCVLCVIGFFLFFNKTYFNSLCTTLSKNCQAEAYLCQLFDHFFLRNLYLSNSTIWTNLISYNGEITKYEKKNE